MPSTPSEWPFTKPLSYPKPLNGRPTAGPHICQWVEANCVYGEGDKEGEPVRLEAFQRYKYRHAGELRADGKWRYKRILVEEPKGNGKTPWLAWLGLYRMRHDRSPVIPVGATSFNQADLLFGDMKACVDASPALQRDFEAFEDRIIVKRGRGRAYKISAKGGTNDGGRPTAYLADEIHELRTPEQQKSYRTTARGVVKRATGLVVAGSTPGEVKGEGLLWELHAHGLKVNAGEIIDPRFLFMWWGALGEGFDKDDPVELARLLRLANPAADLFLDVDEHVASAHTMPAYEYERYHLGRWTQLLAAWLPAGAWDALVDPVRRAAREAGCSDHPLTASGGCRLGCAPSIPHGATITLGFDGSHNGDSTALSACDLNGNAIATVGLWEKPENASRDWNVPYDEVEACIRKAYELYQVRELAYDRRIFYQLFDRLDHEGYALREVSQSEEMADATQRVYEAVAHRQICHDGDPALQRHFGNCVGTVTATSGVRVGKEHRHSTRWIDLAMATVMAYDSAAALTDDAGVLVY